VSQDSLTSTELDAWTTLLGVMVWLPATLDARLKEENLSLSEFQALWWLSLSADGERTMGDLASTASVTPSHLSRIAARLEERGWIARRPDSRDARRTLASLTPPGREKVQQCLPGYYAALREHLFSRLSEEQIRQLGQITSNLMTSLHPECVPGTSS
jgi:DNA-binding MarR family transcriptional regulator